MGTTTRRTLPMVSQFPQPVRILMLLKPSSVRRSTAGNAWKGLMSPIGTKRSACFAASSFTARFERSIDRGVVHAEWITANGEPIEPWVIGEGELRFECRLASSGQVGVFAEQAPNRRWLIDQASRLRAGSAADDEGVGVLNLFAYTGGSTLACAMGGVPVTHVDASRPAVAWGRRNAELCGLADRPIRWIADDAVAFTRRELRRGRRYAGIVLDPPSYGHADRGRDWQIERDLPGLLATALAMLQPDGPAFALLTSHTTELGTHSARGRMRAGSATRRSS